MKTTIKNLRKMLDNREITIDGIVGFIVKIGFLEYIVKGYAITPGDYLPNVWYLSRGEKLYQFTPYNGVEEVNP
jgi:hypothetical protein